MTRNWIGKAVRHLFNKQKACVVDSRNSGIDIKVKWKDGSISDWMSFRAFEVINSLERTDICKHGHEYRLCADCQTEDCITELWRLQDEWKKEKES